MSSIDSFSTKRGSATFKKDRIEFSESTIRYYKSMYKEYWKSDSTWLKTMFALIVLSFPSAFYAIFTVLSMDNGYLIVALMFGFLALLFTIQYARGFRSPDRIELDRIENISYIEGTTPITRPRFIIEYGKNGSTYKRRVNMPSTYTESGEEKLEQAKDAFKQHGFL